MSNTDLDHLSEIRAVYQKRDELKKACASAQNVVAKRKKAFDKAKTALEEAEAELTAAEAQLNAIGPEQKKAMQKVLSLIPKNPDLAHDLIGRVLELTGDSAGLASASEEQNTLL